MKRIVVLSFLTFFNFLQANAQSGWDWQNPLPQGNGLYAVHMFDQSTVIAVGEGSTVMKTTDAGDSWAIRRFADGTANQIRSLHFFNSVVGVAAGREGTIIRTTNSGATWTIQPTGTTSMLYSLHFNGLNDGMAVGSQGTILHTTDGGLSWTLQSSNTTYDLWGISYLANATAIAVGGGSDTTYPFGSHQIIIRTTDNGMNWIPVYAAPKCTLKAVYFANANSGWAASCDSIYHSTDGGITWSNQAAGSASGFFFFDANVGFAVSGQILRKTTDGGNSWVDNTLVTNNMNSIEFYDAAHGFIVGSTGTIMKTTDGGITWQQLSSDIMLGRPGNQFIGVSFNDLNHGVCINSRLVFYTTNGGSTWIERSTGTTDDLRDVFAASANQWIVVTQNSILRTTDAGTSWNRDSLHWGTKIKCLDANNCVVLGDSIPSASSNITLLKTTNAGSSWNRVQTNIYPWGFYRNLFFTDMSHGTIVTDSSIYYTSDGGHSWIRQLVYSKSFRDVFFTTPSSGVVVGSGLTGVILRTSNSGQTWLTASADTSLWFASVSFANATTGYAVGYIGNILKTTDAGATWTKQMTGVVNTFYAVAAPDANHATVVGNIHGVLHTSTGGVAAARESHAPTMPGEWGLNQNYPNPFNPSTLITFSVPFASYVTLRVYNVLGQTIATLVDERISAGNQSITWNAEGVASGVYFYRLQTPSFATTKKLVLLR